MRHKLPRQLSSKTLDRLIAKEIKKQEIEVHRANAKLLKELKEISEWIENKGLPPYLVCKKLPRSLGYGIFLHPKSPALKKGDLIGPYSGELALEPQFDPDDSDYAFAPIADIVLTKKEHEVLDPFKVYHPKRKYVLNLDAQKKGNFTRFINHSEKPNIVAEFIRVPKNQLGLSPSALEVFYFVKKKIRPGEQLLVSYEEGEEKSYWGSMGIKPYPLFPNTFSLNKTLQIQSTDSP